MKRLTLVKKYLHQFECDYKNHHLSKCEWTVQEIIKRYKDSQNYISFKYNDNIMVIEVISDSPVLNKNERKTSNDLLTGYLISAERTYLQILNNIKEIKEEL